MKTMIALCCLALLAGCDSGSGGGKSGESKASGSTSPAAAKSGDTKASSAPEKPKPSAEAYYYCDAVGTANMCIEYTGPAFANKDIVAGLCAAEPWQGKLADKCPTENVLGTCTVDDKGDGKDLLAGKQVQTIYSKGAKELTAEQAKSDSCVIGEWKAK